MSPEQIQGERGDPRSDIYAWGVIMYELLTGPSAVQGRQLDGGDGRPPHAHARAAAEAQPRRAAALEAIIRKAMRRYPENRYQSAAELLHDLDHLDELDLSSFDFSPEAPMGGMAAVESTKRIWQLIADVALAFVLVCALIIGLTVVLR